MTIIYILIGVLLVVVINFVLLKMIMGKKEHNQDDTGLKLLLARMNELARTVDQKMTDVTRTVDTKIGESSQIMRDSLKVQFTESAKLIKDVTEGLTKLDETNRQVVSFADQLQNLQDILKNPKHRGILGEYYLETLLKNVLPPENFQMQYRFSDGEIVDAAVFVKDKIIPIDSKFSLENYNRLIGEQNAGERERLEKSFTNDLKTRIQETAKYIRPSENTLDFAFMFIPHEALYYDLLINKVGAIAEDTENLIQRAASKYKVIVVSPTSFFAYLQTVLQGLKALKIEETAKDMIKRVGELGKHLKNFEEYHAKLGSAITTTVNHYNASSKQFRMIDKDVMRITGESANIQEFALEKPEQI